MTCRPPLRVLVVEDEVLIALELETLLEEAGHEVVAVAGSAAAVEGLSVPAPDLAFVDIHLSDGATGVAVGRGLADRGVAVVFMSANTRKIPSDFAGAVGAIAKPYTERGVQAALAFLGRYLRRKETGPAPGVLTLSPKARAAVAAFPGGPRGRDDRCECPAAP